MHYRLETANTPVSLAWNFYTYNGKLASDHSRVSSNALYRNSQAQQRFLNSDLRILCYEFQCKIRFFKNVPHHVAVRRSSHTLCYPISPTLKNAWCVRPCRPSRCRPRAPAPPHRPPHPSAAPSSPSTPPRSDHVINPLSENHVVQCREREGTS